MKLLALVLGTLAAFAAWWLLMSRDDVIVASYAALVSTASATMAFALITRSHVPKIRIPIEITAIMGLAIGLITEGAAFAITGYSDFSVLAIIVGAIACGVILDQLLTIAHRAGYESAEPGRHESERKTIEEQLPEWPPE
ncbi:hypothetical protein HYV74_01495 [Candidatus Uhrbacteria bacterium]|nr:hypothetical protein [Candidatus Uhrbacteria bacterium]